jgi:hypothetical protein
MTKRKKVEIKKTKTYSINLTKFELLHLRDLFSIVMPPNATVTVSQSLAEAENRTHVEQFLWNKLTELCKEASLPLGDDAPDYIVAPVASPALGVFQISPDPPSTGDSRSILFQREEE